MTTATKPATAALDALLVRLDTETRAADKLAAGGNKGAKHVLALLYDVAAAIRALRAERDWRPIETAPKDGSFAVVALAEWLLVAWWDAAGECWRENYSDNVVQPTHWYPLPDPPSTEGQ